MAANDTLPGERDNVIAAARAAASWARARRAAWTDAPLPTVAKTKAPRRSSRTEPVLTAPPAPALPPAAARTPAAVRDAGPSVATRAADQMRSMGAPVLRWLPRIAAVVALGSGAVLGGSYLWNRIPAKPTRAVVVAPAPVRSQPPKRKPTGGLRITSTPRGAQVLLDGKPRGMTPLTLTDLQAGRHTVELKSDAGSVQRTVTVAADQTAQMDESIFSGWLAVYLPFDVVVTEGGRALRLDERSQVMLLPGPHLVRLVNRTLAYDAVHQVEVKPGETTNLIVKPPPSSLTVTATEPLEVWLDGVRVGETPLNGVPAALGTHEIVVRRAAGGERRITITVTVNPFTLHVDFSKPVG